MDRFAHCSFSPLARQGVCLFGGSQGATQTQTSQTKLPDWVDNAAQSNYGFASQVAANLQKPFEGQRVADMTPGQTQNIAAAQANIGAANPAFQQAQGATSNFLNFNAPQVQAGQLSNTDLNPYMNPFTQNVINTGLSALDVQRQQALNQTGAQAAQARAFGGSRQGVQEGITNAASAAQAGQLVSGLQSQNFTQAQAAAQADMARSMQAQQLNQQSANTGAGISLNAAGQMGQLANQQQQNYMSGLTLAQGFQGQQQQQTQAQLDAARALYGEQGQYPIQQLQILQGALTNSPYGQTVTQTKPGPVDNTAMQAVGAGIGLAGTAAMFMSDRRLKTDIQKVGKDEATGLSLFGYRYKGDPKSYPKVVGPMAQDVQKKFPDQVGKVGDHLAIKASFLGGMMEKGRRLMADDVRKRAFDYYVSQGLSQQAAAAMVGHMMGESGGNPTARETLADGTPGLGRGAFQWTTPSRQAGLQTWAAKQPVPLDPNALETQLGYSLHELDTTEKAAGDKLYAAPDYKSAVDAGMHYLRPGGYTPDNPAAGNGYAARYNYGADLAGAQPMTGPAMAAAGSPSGLLNPSQQFTAPYAGADVLGLDANSPMPKADGGLLGPNAMKGGAMMAGVGTKMMADNAPKETPWANLQASVHEPKQLSAFPDLTGAQGQGQDFATTLAQQRLKRKSPWDTGGF